MNKRHYEHTLPNIRGSLSNTYEKRVGAGEGTYRREKDKRRAWHGRKKERVWRPMQNRGS